MYRDPLWRSRIRDSDRERPVNRVTAMVKRGSRDELKAYRYRRSADKRPRSDTFHN